MSIILKQPCAWIDTPFTSKPGLERSMAYTSAKKPALEGILGYKFSSNDPF